MRRQIQLWGTRLVLVVLLFAAVRYWGLPMYRQYFAPKKPAAFAPTAKVREGRFTVSFHEIGTLEAVRSVSVATETEGKIIYLIDDGKAVQPGDKLFEIDTTDLVREVRNKQLAYSNARADVDRAEAELTILEATNKTELEQAQAQLDFDRNELKLATKERDKQTELAKEKLVPQADVDKADLQVRSKELAVTKGEKALALKEKEVKSKEEQKKADVRNVDYRATMARLDLEEVENRVNKGTVKAPTAGMVVISLDWSAEGLRKFKEGDTPHRREVICQLPDLSQMRVKLKVGEADAPRIHVGLPVLMRLDAVPDRVFHGNVQDISPLASEGSPWDPTTTPGQKNFEVKVSVSETDPKALKPGITADVEFICDLVKNAVYVPLEAVIERGNKTRVFVKQGKRFVPVPVKTGKQNDNSVCITAGLRKGQTVALRDPYKPLEQQEAGVSRPRGKGTGAEKRQPTAVPSASLKG